MGVWLGASMKMRLWLGLMVGASVWLVLGGGGWGWGGRAPTLALLYNHLVLELLPQEAAHPRVPMVLDGVVRAAGEHLGDLGPLGAHLLHLWQGQGVGGGGWRMVGWWWRVVVVGGWGYAY